jgi:hypothetical protein
MAAVHARADGFSVTMAQRPKTSRPPLFRKVRPLAGHTMTPEPASGTEADLKILGGRGP